MDLSSPTLSDKHATQSLVSDTLKPNGRVGTGTRTGVWFRNQPTDLSSCVSEERGHGEGGLITTMMFVYC